MATLSTANRQRIWRGLMRRWSNIREETGLTKAELQAGINATDDWINDNATAYNNALPAAAKTQLTTDQKVLIFSVVALTRADVNTVKLLKKLLGEVD